MKFFFDNCLPPRLVQALDCLSQGDSHELKHLSEKFPRDTKDLVWIPALGREGGWTVISGDIRIFQNPAERHAWLNSGMVAFFLAKGWTALPLWEQAWKLIKVWPEIVRSADRMKPPAGFVIQTRSLKFEQVRI